VAITMVLESVDLVSLGASRPLLLSVGGRRRRSLRPSRPFWSLLDDFLAGAAAAAGIALVTSLESLCGFVSPSIMGTAAGDRAASIAPSQSLVFRPWSR
jgi:hypothetical protein